MTTFNSIILGSIIALTLTLSGCGNSQQPLSQVASNYPPNYTWGQQCVEDATFKVCRSGNNTHLQLKVLYRGALSGHDGLGLYIKLNGRDGVFQYMVAPGGATVLHSAYTSCQWVHGGNRYECVNSPQAVKDLFFYGKDQFGNYNDWELEIAAVDGSGQWDSQFGGNYKYRITRDAPYDGSL